MELVKKYIWKRRGLKILDTGCGTGGLMKKLSKIGNVVGIDFNHEAIKFAKRRGISVKLSTIERIPFRDNRFDLVTCIDVIYHKQVKDDVKALEEIRRVLKPGGLLILRVPANKFLMSAHDKHVHTARRYNKKELASKLYRAGLKIVNISFVHLPIFPLSLVRVGIERLSNQRNSSSVGRVNPILNQIPTWVLNFEAWLIAKGLVIPFGQGLIAVAMK
ncbi:class I SAM-dependent methyltransferase [Candidatus Curtissbacteria bacterium]|nr:class I SAM-dependent methyltransferase [Candidatus Curtissbacteria bacterium]